MDDIHRMSPDLKTKFGCFSLYFLSFRTALWQLWYQQKKQLSKRRRWVMNYEKLEWKWNSLWETEIFVWIFLCVTLVTQWMVWLHCSAELNLLQIRPWNIFFLHLHKERHVHVHHTIGQISENKNHSFYQTEQKKIIPRIIWKEYQF